MALRGSLRVMSLVVAVFSTALVWGEERLRVRVPSDTENRVEELLASLAIAVRDEDFQAFSACFTKAARARYCKAVAPDFVTYDLDFERGKWVLTDASETKPAFLLRYAITKDGAPTWCVSSVECQLEGSRLLIAKEKPLSVEPPTQSKLATATAPLRVNAGAVNCPDGQCRLQPKAKGSLPIKDGKEVLPGISMFNDEHGNPDPKGIMWLDPRQLWARFPDKYGVPKCMRAELARTLKQ